MCDSRGVIYEGRPGLNAEKQEFAVRTEVRTLEEALRGADVFSGLSVADILTEEMVQSMAKDPIVFAPANPNPEISYEGDALPPGHYFCDRAFGLPQPNQQRAGFPLYFPWGVGCTGDQHQRGDEAGCGVCHCRFDQAAGAREREDGVP